MTSAEINTTSRNITLHLGYVKAGELQQYEAVNKSGKKLLGFTKSCGCLGKVSLEDDKVCGEFSPEFKEKEAVEYFVVDGIIAKEANGMKGTYIDPMLNKLIHNPATVESSFRGKEFSQTITVYFDDGVPHFNKNEDGSLIENPDKKVNVNVRAIIQE